MDHPPTEHATEPAVEPDLPGSPAAERQGCCCSVLLNRHTRDHDGFVDPRCPLHGSAEHRSELPSTS
ncbi:hypothetical protein [Actinomycetospora sp. TBRC 11914]|uniref:hypothetical protein n=1 Tax=Actinomycetospora sp. TBRC 11914 TaxID=2729387 RepID=UPI00145F706D|nr:hypothetical protein [Actinomycetospora sp. TBRC 11914]NMO92735.1 hypothetical protein [Actinomycetospora sp. TBRC 11914]